MAHGCIFGFLVAGILFLSPISHTAQVIGLDAAPVDKEVLHNKIKKVLRLDCFPKSEIKAKSVTDPAKEEKAIERLLVTLEGSDEKSAAREIGTYLNSFPASRWTPVLRNILGDRLFSVGRFNAGMETWEDSWQNLKSRDDAPAKELAESALQRMLELYSSLGRPERLRALLAEAEGRVLQPQTRSTLEGAREVLSYFDEHVIQNVLCGPVALYSIKDRLGQHYTPLDLDFIKEESLTTGISCADLKGLCKKLALDFEVIHRNKGGAPIPTPAVVHWKFSHFSAILDFKDGSYLLEDRVLKFYGWISKDVIEEDGSGYFLVSKSSLATKELKVVPEVEAKTIFGKHCSHSLQGGGEGNGGNDPQEGGEPAPGGTPESGPDSGPADPPGCKGMPVYTFYSQSASLFVRDTPLGYTPPFGPPVFVTMSYKMLDAGQDSPSRRIYTTFGSFWSFNYFGFVELPKSSPVSGSSLKVHPPGGGTENYRFDAVKRRYGVHESSRTYVIPVSENSYERVFPNGSKEIYGRRLVSPAFPAPRLLLTALVDRAGNQVILSYDANGRIESVSDALGQKTLFSYEITTDSTRAAFFYVTKLTDPFGRSSRFEYNTDGLVSAVTDIGSLRSTFSYGPDGRMLSMTTPYGTTTFTFCNGSDCEKQANPIPRGRRSLNRMVTATDPLGQTEVLAFMDPAPVLPAEEVAPTETITVAGKSVPFLVGNENLHFRNSFHWDKKAWQDAVNNPANAMQYARAFHWLVRDRTYEVIGALESIKPPLEGRVWFNYPGQGGSEGAHFAGDIYNPSKIARVLDDGSVQLQQFEYNALGNITKEVDPVGRTRRFAYDGNEIDLREISQDGASGPERLAKITYNAQHLPTSITDAAGQARINEFNIRGQVTLSQNTKGETVRFKYDTSGYLETVDGPLPSIDDTIKYLWNSRGLLRSVTDTEGYTLRFDYDDFDRLTKTTFPDETFQETHYDRLHVASFRDRLNRVTTYQYDALRRLVQVEDPLKRIARYDWCRCGDVQTVMDPMGRITRWQHDAQSRLIAKEYVDGSRVQYSYEPRSGRLHRIQDAKGQVKEFSYFPDSSLKSITYRNSQKPTPNVFYTYDDPYRRVRSIQDGQGLTKLTYHPIIGTSNPGAGQLASIDGPWENDTITYAYDALGRATERRINGVLNSTEYDAAGRIKTVENALGAFAYAYVRNTRRLASILFPNGQKSSFDYYNNAGDQRLKEITHSGVGGTFFSRFRYTYDPTGKILTWQQEQGNSPAEIWDCRYDAADQLREVIARRGDVTVNRFAYNYDTAGNVTGATEGAVTTHYSYNSLNEIMANEPPSRHNERTYEWDAEDRVIAINENDLRIECSYDGFSRRTKLVTKKKGVITDERLFLWSGLEICEQRRPDGTVAKSFFPQGVKDGSEPRFYARDHLGSVRAVTALSGEISNLSTYTPFGEMIKLAGNYEPDVSFTGHLWNRESGLILAPFRLYDPSLRRWLSRDPIGESVENNLFAYAKGDPVNLVDPDGLAPRDRRFGLPNDFWDWYHRNRKRPGYPDLNRGEAHDYYEEWKAEGRPRGDKKGKHRGNKGSCEPNPEPVPAPVPTPGTDTDPAASPSEGDDKPDPLPIVPMAPIGPAPELPPVRVPPIRIPPIRIPPIRIPIFIP